MESCVSETASRLSAFVSWNFAVSTAKILYRTTCSSDPNVSMTGSQHLEISFNYLTVLRLSGRNPVLGFDRDSQVLHLTDVVQSTKLGNCYPVFEVEWSAPLPRILRGEPGGCQVRVRLGDSVEGASRACIALHKHVWTYYCPNRHILPNR